MWLKSYVLYYIDLALVPNRHMPLAHGNLEINCPAIFWLIVVIVVLTLFPDFKTSVSYFNCRFERVEKGSGQLDETSDVKANEQKENDAFGCNGENTHGHSNLLTAGEL